MAAIVRTLAEHPHAVQECRIAFSLLQGPIKGIRGLEAASGLSDKQVWEITSAEDGGLSPYGLVQTIERGTSWTSDGREKGSYALADTDRDDVTREFYIETSPFLSKEGWREGKEVEHHRDVVPIGIALQILDPSLDLWRRGATDLGSEGWRVAVLTGLAPVEMSMAEWTELAGVTEANARKLARKFEAHSIATRTKKGRTVRISVDWAVYVRIAEDEGLGDLTRRARDLANQHAREQVRIQRPLSYEELEIRRRVKWSATFAATQLREALDEAESPEHQAALEKLLHVYAGATEADWRRWMELDEEPEQGLIPDSPEALEELGEAPVKERPLAAPVAQPAPKDSRSEADMKARLLRMARSFR
ncbi:hypothetical protein [Streptomyces sp. NPDC057438]|uniref:hypothetical protein n=1 Tax=Streptomyces sp. NPDC057438 TaxID=3346133 RepID=UPI0036ADC3B3